MVKQHDNGNKEQIEVKGAEGGIFILPPKKAGPDELGPED